MILIQSSAFLRRLQKFAQSSSWFWRLLSKFQNHQEDCANFWGLLRKAELYWFKCTFFKVRLRPEKSVDKIRFSSNCAMRFRVRTLLIAECTANILVVWNAAIHRQSFLLHSNFTTNSTNLQFTLRFLHSAMEQQRPSWSYHNRLFLIWIFQNCILIVPRHKYLQSCVCTMARILPTGLIPKTTQNYKPLWVPNTKIPMEFRDKPNPYPGRGYLP